MSERRYQCIADEYRVSQVNRGCTRCSRGIEPSEPFIREVWIMDDSLVLVIYHALGCPS